MSLFDECLNSVVWSKAPKHKFKGPKSVEMASMSAVLQFDCGQRGRQEVMKLAKIPRGHDTIQGARRKDKKRIYSASREANKVQKGVQVAKRQAKLVWEQEAIEKDGGPAYASGAFNKDSVVHSNASRNDKKKNSNSMSVCG